MNGNDFGVERNRNNTAAGRSVASVNRWTILEAESDKRLRTKVDKVEGEVFWLDEPKRQRECVQRQERTKRNREGHEIGQTVGYKEDPHICSSDRRIWLLRARFHAEPTASLANVSRAVPDIRSLFTGHG